MDADDAADNLCFLFPHTTHKIVLCDPEPNVVMVAIVNMHTKKVWMLSETVNVDVSVAKGLEQTIYKCMLQLLMKTSKEVDYLLVREDWFAKET